MLKLESEFSIQMLLLCSESCSTSSWLPDMWLLSNRSSGGGEIFSTGRLEGVIWWWCWCWETPPPLSPQPLVSLASVESISAFLRLLASPGVPASCSVPKECTAKLEEVEKALLALPLVIAEVIEEASAACTIRQWIKVSPLFWLPVPSKQRNLRTTACFVVWIANYNFLSSFYECIIACVRACKRP